MMLKWGSIYHRSKKSIVDSVDIIDSVEVPIDGSLFYNNNTSITYNSTPESIGFHPYYETVFHQNVNGYSFFNPLSGDTYEDSITTGITYLYTKEVVDETTYTSFIDNTRFGFSGYTLLPTNGYNTTYGTDFTKSEQENFRIVWGTGTSDQEVIDYSGQTIPSYNEYFKDSVGDYSLETNHRKVIDLIATFKPDILDVFEQAFLDFSSEKLNEEVSYSPYNMTYSKFQDLLKKICSVTKDTNDTTPTTAEERAQLMKKIKTRQVTQLKSLSSQLLSSENLVKIVLGNPREVDNYVLGGFTGVNVQNFSTNPYVTPSPDDIELYLGEDIDGYYDGFFQTMDIEVNETNVKQFRPLAYMYAGLRVKNEYPSKSDFVEYLKENLISPNFGATATTDPVTKVSGQDTRLYVYLKHLIDQFKDLEPPSEVERATAQRGYNDDPIKLELYNYFKSFNDKWTAGNSIGQRTLMEEFLFLDKANKDIGNEVFLDMQRLTRLGEPGNRKINLFSLISLLVQDSGFDIRALPAYVNFYGTSFTNSLRTIPSKDVAQSMFGTFLDVDHQDSSPKVILQYTGPTSKHLELADIDKKQKYKNDGFDIGNVNNNPIIVSPDVFTKTDFTKSNKVVAFEVSFGDQNQSIFKGVELDQATLKNTSESFEVMERLGRNETGSSTSQIDIGLFNIYRQSSYQCKVTAMGNMMIQPTMYFYIKNIPLFRGSYLITEVTHNIRTTGVETSFKGTRIPQASLPDPSDSFLASYRPLFDRLVRKATAQVEAETRALLSGNTSGIATTLIDGEGKIYSTDPGTIEIKGEKSLKEANMTSYGIPYNGYMDQLDTQLVKYHPTKGSQYRQGNDKEWLRAVVLRMGGPNYPISDNSVMNIISNLTYGTGGNVKTVTWADVKDRSHTDPFYSANFIMNAPPPHINVTPDAIHHDYSVTEFLNPFLGDNRNREIVIIENRSNFTGNVYTGPINVGPALSGYGLGLSSILMDRLGVKDGQVVYFRMT